MTKLISQLLDGLLFSLKWKTIGLHDLKSDFSLTNYSGVREEQQFGHSCQIWIIVWLNPVIPNASYKEQKEMRSWSSNFGLDHLPCGCRLLRAGFKVWLRAESAARVGGSEFWLTACSVRERDWAINFFGFQLSHLQSGNTITAFVRCCIPCTRKWYRGHIVWAQ